MWTNTRCWETRITSFRATVVDVAVVGDLFAERKFGKNWSNSVTFVCYSPPVWKIILLIICTEKKNTQRALKLKYSHARSLWRGANTRSGVAASKCPFPHRFPVPMSHRSRSANGAELCNSMQLWAFPPPRKSLPVLNLRRLKPSEPPPRRRRREVGAAGSLLVFIFLNYQAGKRSGGWKNLRSCDFLNKWFWDLSGVRKMKCLHREKTGKHRDDCAFAFLIAVSFFSVCNSAGEVWNQDSVRFS